MPRRHFASFVLAVAIAACGSADAPSSAALNTGPTQPGASSPGAVVPRGAVAREILVNTTFLFEGPRSTTGATIESNLITWTSSDGSVATVGPYGGGYARVLGTKPGKTVIGGSVFGVTAAMPVTVLAPAPASAASPIAVQFRLVEAPGFAYVPDLVLRDTSGRGGSALIAFSVELPGLGQAPGCAMLREIGATPLTVFHERYGDFEVWYGDGRKAGPGEAIAQLTLRLPGGIAKIVTVSGPIVPGGEFPTTYTPDRGDVDVLSCG